MDARQVTAMIGNGETIVNIGQLTDCAKKALRKMVASGTVEKGISHRFPIPKTCYASAAIAAQYWLAPQN